MPSFPLDARRLPAATAIVAAVPAGPIALMTTGSGRLALFALALVPAVVIVVGPRLWPGWSRLGGLVLIGPVMVTMIVPGLFALFLAFFELCASYQTRTYLSAPGAAAAICAFFLPYALGSGWAVARPSRALWAWPLVMLAAIALSIVVLRPGRGRTAPLRDLRVCPVRGIGTTRTSVAYSCGSPVRLPTMRPRPHTTTEDLLLRARREAGPQGFPGYSAVRASGSKPAARMVTSSIASTRS